MKNWFFNSIEFTIVIAQSFSIPAPGKNWFFNSIEFNGIGFY